MSEVLKWAFAGPFCANIEGGANCQNKANLACSRCHLVKYCSADCQKTSWECHKNHCRSQHTKAQWVPKWEKEKRAPRELDMLTTYMAGPPKFLFGNMPAIDILKGTDRVSNTKDGLDLCFAACGDIRNVVQTILNVPVTIEKRIRVLLNDFDDIAAIRCVMLLMLALSDEPNTAAEQMLHLWYSAFLPKELLSKVTRNLKEAPEKHAVHKGLKKFVKMQWIAGDKTQSVVTASKTIKELENHLNTARLKFTECEITRKNRTLSLDVFDDMETNMFAMNKFRRVSYSNFILGGLVLPLGAAINLYTEPNPLIFSPSGKFYLNAAANPAHGWKGEEVNSFVTSKDLPKNDQFGSLHTFLLSKLTSFSQHIRQLNIDFIITNEDCKDLPRVLQTCEKADFPQQFDTIEISNICDSQYMDTKVLDVLSPLLKPATPEFTPAIIGLHITAADDALEWEEPSMHWQRKKPSFDRILSVLELDKNELEVKTATHKLVISALHLYIQVEDLFEIYRKKKGFEKVEKANKLRVRENKVVEMWPNRLKRGTVEEERKQIYDISAEGTKGWERYVEWVRDDSLDALMEDVD